MCEPVSLSSLLDNFLIRGKVVVPWGFEHVNSKSQSHQDLETKELLRI